MTGGTARFSSGPNLDGAGTEVSAASADGATGAFNASAEAVGGNSLLPILIRVFLPPDLIPGQGPSTAAANAGVNRSFAVGPGRSRVTITYSNAQGVGTTTGRGTAASCVQTSASAAGSFEPAIAFDDRPATTGAVSRSFVLEVPEGEQGPAVSATAVVIASADGKGNSGTARATVGQTTISVDAI